MVFPLVFQYVLSGFPLCLSSCTVAYIRKKLAKVLHFFEICKFYRKKIQNGLLEYQIFQLVNFSFFRFFSMLFRVVTRGISGLAPNL